MSGRRPSRTALASSVVIVAAALGGCDSGPSTKDEVCTTFTELGRQVALGTGISDNPVFRKAGDLSSLADRFPDADLSGDAEALHKIAKSDNTTELALERATTGIANLCGHPLSSSSLLGD